MVVKVGTSAGETIEGSTDADSLKGEGGNDIIRGLGTYGTADFLYGGDGNDTIFGGFGVEQTTGDAGDDSIYSSSGNDILNGGTGNDTFFVSGSDNGFDYYSGDPSGGIGNDIIVSSTTQNTVIGINSLQEVDAIQGNASRTTTIQLPVGGASIDFSRTQLTNISDISGDSGVDNIIGSLQSDLMFLYAGNDFYTDRNSAPSNSVDNIYAGAGNDAAIFGAGKSGNTLTANADGTWTIRDTTLSVTYTVRHTAQTSWKVSSSTGSTANLYDVETVSFGDKQLTSTAPITPQSLSSEPATMEFTATSSETDNTMSDGAAVSAERDDVLGIGLDADYWTASYTQVASIFDIAYMAYDDLNANGASSLTTVSMLTPPTEVMTLTVV